MSTVGLGHSNLTDAATLSGSGYHASFPVTNLQGAVGRRLAVYAQTTSGALELIMDHGVAVNAQYFGLFAHNNVDPLSTIRVLRGSTLGGTEVWDSAELSCWPHTPVVYSGRRFGMHVVAPANTLARYTKITVTSSMPFLRVGRPMVAPLFLPTHNPSYGNLSDGWMDSFSSVARADGGADEVWQRHGLRSAPFGFSALTDAEASVFYEIMGTHDITGEVAFVRSTYDRALQQQRGFLGLMRKMNPLDPRFLGYQTTALVIDERGGAP